VTGISTGPKLFLPGLVPLYRHIVPLSWLVIRCTVGLILFYHGTKKIGHVDGVTANMIKNSLSPPVLIAYVVILTETVGVFCVAIGFFTRFFAAACAIDLAVITFHVL